MAKQLKSYLSEGKTISIMDVKVGNVIEGFKKGEQFTITDVEKDYVSGYSMGAVRSAVRLPRDPELHVNLIKESAPVVVNEGGLSNPDIVKYVRSLSDSLTRLSKGVSDRLEYRLIKNVSYTGDKAQQLAQKVAGVYQSAIAELQNLMNRDIG